MNRLSEVEIRLGKLKDDSEDEVRRVRLELEKEKQEHVATRQRLEELESERDQLQVIVSEQSRPAGSRPQTPRTNGSAFARSQSPFMTPGSTLYKNSTQVVEELYRVKGELMTEKRRLEKAQAELDSTSQQLDLVLPRLDNLQKENDALREEVSKDQVDLGGIFQDMDRANKAAKRAEKALKAAQAEADLLRGQVRDLSAQIQLLVFNEHARQQGLEELSLDEVRQYDELRRRDIVKDSLDDMTAGEKQLSEGYVVFKDVADMQTRNAELLKATRELMKVIDEMEVNASKHQSAKDQEEVHNLQSQVATLQDRVQSLGNVVESAERQRDMFRRLLQRRATADEISTALGGNGDGGVRDVLASIEPNSTPEAADMSAAYRDLQNQYDSYRREQDLDRKTLREQMDKMSVEKSAVQMELSKVTSQLTLSAERFDMLNANFTAAQVEIRELNKRNQALSESATKQDIAIQQIGEDLVQAKSLSDSLRTKTATLEAEKVFFQSIRDRLAADNESLQDEKQRLNTMLKAQQDLQNERELTDSENRRRLQSQVDSLESELTATRRKLAEEAEERKQAQLRKEYDAQQFQKRLDDLMATLSQIKEESVAAKTARDHLQARVNELTTELRNAEDRTERLRPQLTSRAPVAGMAGEASDDAEARIQELNDEVAELKRDLELANTHLENARAQAEQYKGLSQAAEEELANLNTAQEQYREEMDILLRSNDTKVKELQQRVEDLSSELAQTNNELSSVRDSQAEVTRRHEEEKRIVEAEVARLKDDNERQKEAAKFHHQDLRAQADIAAKAQQDYEEELVKHAEATRLLQTLRNEHNQLKLQSSTLKAQAEAARISLTQAEGSWEEQRRALEEELSDLKARREDTNAQNKLLHQQLESLTSQISTIQQSRASVNGTDESGTAGSGADQEGLRELINYLRREKEILEVQYDFEVQKSGMLTQQLQHAQSQLDETRLKLEQERQSQADANRTSMTHRELMDKLNELNLIRESNVTLRNELRHAQSTATQSTAKIEELQGRIQPLEARITELESQKQFLEADLKQVQEDRDRWQKRTEGILSKYGRVDPEEQEEMKRNITELEAERDSLKQSEEQLKAKITELEAAVEAEKTARSEMRNRLGEQFKERSKRLTTEKNQALEQLNAASERTTAIEGELESARADKTSLEEKVGQLQAQLQSSSQAQSQPGSTAATESGDTAALEQQLATARQEIEALKSQIQQLTTELDGLREQLNQAVTERDQAKTEAEVLQAKIAGQETAQAIDATTTQPAGGISVDTAALQAQVVAAEAKVAELQSAIDAKAAEFNQRASKMRDQLNTKLRDSREALAKEREELRIKLEDDFKLKLEQERAIWQAENPGSATTTTATTGPNGTTPATPVKTDDAPSTPQTATAGSQVIDMAKLTDAEVKNLVANNPTLKSIVGANIKKRIDAETQRLRETLEQSVKADQEQRIKDAREQEKVMGEKKANLRINMAENKARNANAKLSIIETAARDTPQRPVGEVWNIAKDAKPAPSTSPAPSSQSSITGGPTTPQAAAAQPSTTNVPTGKLNSLGALQRVVGPSVQILMLLQRLRVCHSLP
jgi:nucleoprotein TPR